MPGTRASAALGSLVLLAAWPRAQDVASVRQVLPLDEAAASAAGITLQRRNDKVVQVRAEAEPPLRLALGEPVTECRVGRTADGRCLAILAGGLQESLTISLVDLRSGASAVFPTHGGRLLPGSFQDGLGSWPLLEEDGLVFFAFERDGRVLLRAVDWNGAVYLATELSEGASGYAIRIQETTRRVHVDVRGGAPLSFLHPRAPRLEIVPQRPEFGLLAPGIPGRAQVLLRNAGGRPLDLEWTLRGAGFAIQEPAALRLGPGQERAVRVEASAAAPGVLEGVLHVRAAAGLGWDVPLRAEVVAATAIEPAPRAEAPEAEAAAALPAPAPSPAPGRPRLAELSVDPLPGQTLRIRGAFAGSDRPDSFALLDGVAHCGSATVDGAGRFEVEVPWRPGALLTLALPGAVPPLPFVAAPPRLRDTEAGVLVQGRPGGDVLLVQWSQPPRDGRGGRVLQAWWARLDSRGSLLLRAGSLAGSAAAHMQAFTADRLRSNLLEVRPRA